MAFRRNAALTLLLCLIALALSSCLSRNRLIARIGGKPTQTLLTADRSTLVDIISRQYNAIDDFNAEVDMVPALGSAEKSKITEYKDVRAYILFRKPAAIRIIGLYPIVRNKAFDMVSIGTDFKLYIPAKDRFLVGRNEVEKPSANKLENLRPQHFLEAMLVRPVDKQNDKLLVENFTDEGNAFYILHIVHENGDGQLTLARTVWFNRYDLVISRQLVFDDAGNIMTDARYSGWKAYDNVAFPKHMEINRPKDEYGVVIDVVKMDIDKGVAADKFVLDQPEGSTLQVVGEAPPPAPPAPPSKGRTKKK
jgi:outer membrane lipoprotein-sorting protein